MHTFNSRWVRINFRRSRCSIFYYNWPPFSKLHFDVESAAFKYRPGSHTELIHHSDRGNTYASHAYQKVLLAHGVKPSMSAKGNCYDNAAMESFFGRLKNSTLKNKTYTDETHVRDVVFEYNDLRELRVQRFQAASGANGGVNPSVFIGPGGCWRLSAAWAAAGALMPTAGM